MHIHVHYNMCHDHQIFSEVQIISLSLQTCQNYGAFQLPVHRDGMPICEATR